MQFPTRFQLVINLKIAKAIGRGFDVVFDGLGEKGYRRSFAALKRGGPFCAYGYCCRARG